ncbi:MAG: prolyl oligopeptidase family serine peptidase [Verrucomicrobia bacterium]|nr:prolyl oligopeptidase family serine peptidase [Verrucomicrobiota bacterium]
MNFPAALILLTSLQVSAAFSQDVRAEMERAKQFGRDASSLLRCNELRPFWPTDGAPFAYRINTERDGHRFFQVNLTTGAKSPAFDHDALARALATAAAQDVRAGALPLEELKLTPEPGNVRFRAFGKGWRFDAAKSQVSPAEVPPETSKLMAPEEVIRGPRRNGGATSLTIENATTGEIELFWLEDRERRVSYGRIAAGASNTLGTYAGHAWLMTDAAGTPLAGVVAKDAPSLAHVTGKIAPAPRPNRRGNPSPDGQSPDGKWHASIKNHNLTIEPVAGGEAIPLSSDGTPEDGYNGPLQWSPDSKKLVAWRAKDVQVRQIHLVQSSPPDQVQPKLQTFDYAKPGDPIRQPKPRLFDIDSTRQIPIDDTLFDNPWEISEFAWSADAAEFSCVYNQRGHQVLRILGVRADSGSVRTILEERSKTFIDYSGKFYLHRLPATRELLWASERDGYNHLYLIDEGSGQVKTQVTSGPWNVREVMVTDVEKRQLLLKVVGLPGQDPYHVHYARVNFDGSGFTRLTASDGNHRIEFSPDRNWLLDTWSRVDQPPVVELRRADTGALVAELERADDSALQQTGWSRPERFTAKGRDGTTDIYGIIIRPTRFDPAKKYPVVEDIYAGPQDHFVPKSYFTWSNKNAMAELGFIIVSIDGMGTAWRSKAFHDVCWKNLADSGFPDRIPWIKSAAATRPWMDLSRVGIYGGSAGGQSTLAGLLHHGDFYQVGVADCGCHDNRMDKMWWNEAWMGWPVDASYAENSNTTHVAKLTGKLMLVVGELDHNVDPASTAQVVAALQRAGKDFDFLPIMNSDHGAAESPYGSYRRAEFLVRHLQAARLPQ